VNISEMSIKIPLQVFFVLSQFLVLNAQTTGIPCKGLPIVIYEGKTYNTVQIGTQCWLKENLNIGIMIDSTKDQANNGIVEKYCFHNKPANCETYGGLYQWGETVQYENGATNSISPNPAFSGNVKGICPGGWHIPSEAEIQTLQTEAGNNGNVLKAVGEGTGVGAGTNTSGFSALLAGYRYTSSRFNRLGCFTRFWSSEGYGSDDAFVLDLFYDSNKVYLGGGYKGSGFSVRCIKD
jgi:uncharacterized protein (TIGR02145 family)